MANAFARFILFLSSYIPLWAIFAIITLRPLPEVRMQARLAKRPDVLDRRRETVEHPFGSIKQWMNQGAFLMRGLRRCAANSA